MSIADLGTQEMDIPQMIVTSSIQMGNAPLTIYSNYGVAGTFSGPFGIHGPVPGTGRYIAFGKSVILSMNAILAQTDNNAIITYSLALPVKPAQTVNIPIYVIDGPPSTVIGRCSIDTNGIMTIYKAYDGVFTGASNSGFPAFTVCYDSV